MTNFLFLGGYVAPPLYLWRGPWLSPYDALLMETTNKSVPLLLQYIGSRAIGSLQMIARKEDILLCSSQEVTRTWHFWQEQ